MGYGWEEGYFTARAARVERAKRMLLRFGEGGLHYQDSDTMFADADGLGAIAYRI